MTAIRKRGELWWLRPDGKTQIVMISTQHVKPSKATSCKEVAGYTGIDEVAPSMNEMNDPIVEKVVKRTLAGIKVERWQIGRDLVR